MVTEILASLAPLASVGAVGIAVLACLVKLANWRTRRTATKIGGSVISSVTGVKSHRQ